MDPVTIIPYSDAAHRGQVVVLWDMVFAYKTPHSKSGLVIDKKLAVNDDLFFVATDGGSVVGTVMAGYDGHRGWIYTLAVLPSHQGKGIGTQLMAFAEQALTDRGCMKINLQIMEGNEKVAAFYSALGYSVEKRVSMSKKIPKNVPSTQ